MITGDWNELTNSNVNAINISSLKADLDSLPILAAKAYQAQLVQPTAASFVLLLQLNFLTYV